MITPFVKLFYGFIAFLSAFLLFWIQPLISKQFTPLLGGSPMVWNTLLFLFQFLLLAGYTYVALIATKLNNLPALLLHFGVICLTLFALPISFNTGAISPNVDFPTIWLLKEIFILIGLPFFFLATTAPLLQIWYFRSFPKDNKNKKEAYFLYAISNLGSFGALFAFLFFIEPTLNTSTQINLWSKAILIIFGFLLVCGAYLTFKNKDQIKEKKKSQKRKPPIIKEKIIWLVLAFVPASLLHGVTVYITNDLLSLPIFWVIPLGIYLLTFVFAFSTIGQKLQKYILKIALPAAFIPLIVLFGVDPLFSLTLFFLHVVMFSILSQACHGELYKLRPHEEHLSSFYLWIAIGGALAGFFNVILAPVIFESIFEYTLTIALAVFILLYIHRAKRKYTKVDLIKPLLFPLLTALLILLTYVNIPNIHSIDFYLPYEERVSKISIIPLILLTLLSCCIIFYIFYFRKHALNLALFFVCLSILLSATTPRALFGFINTNIVSEKEVIFTERNFYGIIRVIDTPSDGLRKYHNGAGGHNSKDLYQKPTLYGDKANSYRPRIINHAFSQNLPVAILGMGPASYQCYIKPNQKIEYFEINPAVVKMAEDPSLFGFLEHCGGHYSVKIGDARLELSKEKDKKYGAILSTIYWSSTVPFHLFTKEALDMYLSKLTDGGHFSIIIPNHYFDFAPLFAAYNKQSPYKFHVIQEAGNPFFRTFILKKEINATANPDWQTLDSYEPVQLWTDDFYNIWDVLKNPKNMRLTKDGKRFDLL